MRRQGSERVGWMGGRGHLFVLFSAALVLMDMGAGAASPGIPMEIGGFRLGESISTYGDQILRNAEFVERERPYLCQFRIVPPPGYRGGYVTAGHCRNPGIIVRIKLGYQDRSMKFFRRLMSLLEARYGKATEYRGDPFQNLISWKWSFMDQKGRRVGLIVQHYRGADAEHNRGNVIKLTYHSLIDQERECYMAKHPGGMVPHREMSGGNTKAPDWSWFLPKE